MTDEDNHFTGHQPSECGEHRTVGPHRAWCFVCTEWCYPRVPCKGCELPLLRREIEVLRAQLEAGKVQG